MGKKREVKAGPQPAHTHMATCTAWRAGSRGRPPWPRVGAGAGRPQRARGRAPPTPPAQFAERSLRAPVPTRPLPLTSPSDMAGVRQCVWGCAGAAAMRGCVCAYVILPHAGAHRRKSESERTTLLVEKKTPRRPLSTNYKPGHAPQTKWPTGTHRDTHTNTRGIKNGGGKMRGPGEKKGETGEGAAGHQQCAGRKGGSPLPPPRPRQRPPPPPPPHTRPLFF